MVLEVLGEGPGRCWGDLMKLSSEVSDHQGFVTLKFLMSEMLGDVGRSFKVLGLFQRVRCTYLLRYFTTVSFLTYG